jgi:hypothetical protein
VICRGGCRLNFSARVCAEIEAFGFQICSLCLNVSFPSVTICPMCTSHSLLVKATRKLLELRSDRAWFIQLPSRCPPVLWFGNGSSPKPKVLTFGANPSRKEFLSDSAAQAIEKVRSSGDQSLLSYLEPPDSRLRLLTPVERMADILDSESLRDEIIASYNSYFAGKPYKKWFGHNRDGSYYVEGFLRGFGASYYDGNATRLQAIHIDLFPFVTLDDFGQIKEIADTALFGDGWVPDFVGQLVEALSPEVLILFGRTNCGYFAKYIDGSLSNVGWDRFPSGQYFVGHSEKCGLPVIGLSTNLGNPKGFTAATLKQFGEHVQSALKK